MPNFDERSLLIEARQFAQTAAWAQVVAHLQRLLQGEGAIAPKKLAQIAISERQQWLNLAIQALEWGDFQLRWEIAKLLPRFEQDAMTALIELLSDDELHPDVRWFAVRTLAEFDAPEVVPTLLEIIQSSSQPELQQVAANALSQMGPDIVPLLVRLLEQGPTRLIAVQILAQMRHRTAVPLLLELSRDENAAIRAMAIEALSGFHSPQVAQVLLKALSDYASEVRLTAVRSVGFCLADLPDTDWLLDIQPLLHDVDLAVSRQAALTLGRLGGGGAAKALAEVLRSPLTPEPLAIDIIHSLCWMEQPEALIELGQIWATTTLSEPLRRTICHNLGRVEAPAICDQAVKLLLKWLRTDASVSQSSELQQAIVTALGQLGDPQSIDALICCLALAQQRARLHIAAALKRIDAVQAQQRLRQISQVADDVELRRSATAILNQW